MEFDELSNRVMGVKTGSLMNFNATSAGVVNRTGYYPPPRLKSGIKRFVFFRALRVFRDEAVLGLWRGIGA